MQKQGKHFLVCVHRGVFGCKGTNASQYWTLDQNKPHSPRATQTLAAPDWTNGSHGPYSPRISNQHDDLFGNVLLFWEISSLKCITKYILGEKLVA